MNTFKLTVDIEFTANAHMHELYAELYEQLNQCKELSANPKFNINMERIK